MKIKNSIPARLLSTDSESKIWIVRANLSGGAWIEQRFSHKDLAQLEFNRCKGQPTMAGRWLEGLEIYEEKQ